MQKSDLTPYDLHTCVHFLQEYFVFINCYYRNLIYSMLLNCGFKVKCVGLKEHAQLQNISHTYSYMYSLREIYCAATF